MIHCRCCMCGRFGYFEEGSGEKKPAGWFLIPVTYPPPGVPTTVVRVCVDCSLRLKAGQ